MEDTPFRVQATGQGECFNEQGQRIDCAGSGQDGETRAGLPLPTQRFRVDGEVAHDLLTGLCWPLDAGLGEFPMMWQEALDFVAKLNAAESLGYSDWRLPARRELLSLLCYQRTRPPLPAGHPFVNLFASWYWSATSAAYHPAHAWYLDMDGGRMFYGGKEQSFMLWPVRGKCPWLPPGQRACYGSDGRRIDCEGSGQDGAFFAQSESPAPRYFVHAQVVTDLWTGLQWFACADLAPGQVSWGEALEVVAALAGESARPWRLPNINELESLVDYDHAKPALSPGMPLSAVRDGYWSSTTSVYESGWAWALYLDKGALGVGQKKGRYFHVMAVR